MSDFEFYDKKPSCFQSFNLIDALGTSSGWVTGPEFKSMFVVCSCGNELLNAYTSEGDGMNLAPLIIECPVCLIKAEVFNPEVHGWDGMIGYHCSMTGDSTPSLKTKSPSKLVVEYSYQGAENYDELLEDGVEDPENYFDTFSAFIASNNGSLSTLITYECA